MTHSRRPSWISSYLVVLWLFWPLKWIPWPKFGYFRGIKHESSPNFDDFVKIAVFKMAANAILNISNSSTITSGYRLGNCSSGPILQESILKKTLTIFFILPIYMLSHTLTTQRHHQVSLHLSRATFLDALSSQEEASHMSTKVSL